MFSYLHSWLNQDKFINVMCGKYKCSPQFQDFGQVVERGIPNRLVLLCFLSSLVFIQFYLHLYKMYTKNNVDLSRDSVLRIYLF